MQRTIFFCGRSIPSQKRKGPISLICIKFAPQDFICQVMGWCGCWFFWTQCMNPMKRHKISDSDCQMTPKKVSAAIYKPKCVSNVCIGSTIFREETKGSYFIKEEPNINHPFIPKATLSPKWSNYQLSFSAWKQTKTTTQHSISSFKSVWFCVVLWVSCFLLLSFFLLLLLFLFSSFLLLLLLFSSFLLLLLILLLLLFFFVVSSSLRLFFSSSPPSSSSSSSLSSSSSSVFFFLFFVPLLLRARARALGHLSKIGLFRRPHLQMYQA